MGVSCTKTGINRKILKLQWAYTVDNNDIDNSGTNQKTRFCGDVYKPYMSNIYKEGFESSWESGLDQLM